MRNDEQLMPTPWDKNVFGIDTYELKSVFTDVLERIKKMKGHFTVKVDPLSCKKKLQEAGFYYCDTLIEPYCDSKGFKDFYHESARLSYDINIEDLMKISDGAFSHGRFHRDFNLDKKLADSRYNNWLREFYDLKKIIALMYEDDLAGFWCVNEGKVPLHALSVKYRGKGLAKYFWSAGCRELFSKGFKEISSSISASNLAVLNLYASLGFKFRNPLDIYHKFNP